MSGNITNNQREILFARSTVTSTPEYLSSTGHALNVNATISGTGSVNLAQVGGANIALGQTTMSASLPVTLASNQSALSTTVTNIGPGAGIGDVRIVNTNAAAVKAASTPVVLADPALVVAMSPFSFSHIATAATTTVKSGAGVLHSITVNSLGTVASTTTAYDNTAGSGTVIGILNTLTLSGAFIYDLAFATGLTLVTTGTVAPDITVVYK